MQNKLSVVPLFQSPYQASYLLWDNWRPLSFPTHLPPPSKRLQWKMACKNTLPKLPYLLWWLNIHVKQRVKGRKSIHRMSLGTITVWLRRTSQAVGGQITTMRGYSFSVSKKQLKRNISRKKKILFWPYLWCHSSKMYQCITSHRVLDSARKIQNK